MEPYIDAHSHIWTPDVQRYPLAPGFKPGDMHPPSFTAEELLALCRPAGVGRVNLIQMSFYGFDNSYMLDTIRQDPARFVGTAIVNPFGPDPAREMHDLRSKGVRAFRIQSVGPYAKTTEKLPAARWLEPPGYAAMFAAAAENHQALSALVGPDALPEIDRMCRKFSETTVIIDHLARIGADGTIRRGDVDALLALAKHRRVLVKIGAFYALGKKTPPYLDLAPLIKAVVQIFGADRCMWESDCPFQVVQHKYTDSISLIRDKLDFLSDDDRDWLLWKTAEATLFRS